MSTPAWQVINGVLVDNVFAEHLTRQGWTVWVAPDTGYPVTARLSCPLRCTTTCTHLHGYTLMEPLHIEVWDFFSKGVNSDNYFCRSATTTFAGSSRPDGG
jgi:hypothetical protein